MKIWTGQDPYLEGIDIFAEAKTHNWQFHNGIVRKKTPWHPPLAPLFTYSKRRKMFNFHFPFPWMMNVPRGGKKCLSNCDLSLPLETDRLKNWTACEKQLEELNRGWNSEKHWETVRNSEKQLGVKQGLKHPLELNVGRALKCPLYIKHTHPNSKQLLLQINIHEVW